MNRRSFLSIFALAPVAGVMAARDAMAAPAISDRIFVQGMAGEFFMGESVGEWFLSPNQVRKLEGALETFGVDSVTGHEDRLLAAYRESNSAPRPAEDESAAAQFRDEPGVVL
jgi:hypothetical protein